MRHGRHRFQVSVVGNRFHRAAVGVAADHDVSDAQRHDGVFDGGGNTAWLWPERRHDVASITNDKELSWILLGH